MSTHYLNSAVIPMRDTDFDNMDFGPCIRHDLWKDGDEGFLLIFGSYCPHCISKIGLWKHLAEMMHNDYPEHKFLIMAADVNEDCPHLAEELGINAVPTLLHVDSTGHLEKHNTNWEPQELVGNILESSASRKTASPSKAAKAAKSTKPRKTPTPSRAVKPKRTAPKKTRKSKAAKY